MERWCTIPENLCVLLVQKEGVSHSDSILGFFRLT